MPSLLRHLTNTAKVPGACAWDMSSRKMCYGTLIQITDVSRMSNTQGKHNIFLKEIPTECLVKKLCGNVRTILETDSV